MSNNRLIFEGLEQFKAELRNLPHALTGEGGGIVTNSAEQAKGEIVAEYQQHIVTGNLAKGVKVTTETSAFGTIATIRSTARHSHLYEFGTQVRQNKQGANRGAMPDPTHPTFIPIMQRRRKGMWDALKGLLTRVGFQVTGDV